MLFFAVFVFLGGKIIPKPELLSRNSTQRRQDAKARGERRLCVKLSGECLAGE